MSTATATRRKRRRRRSYESERLELRQVYGDAVAAAEAAQGELARNRPANAFGLYRYALSMQLLGMWVERSGNDRTTVRSPDALAEKLRRAAYIDGFTCRTLRAVLESVPERPSYRHCEAMAAAFRSLRLDPISR